VLRAPLRDITGLVLAARSLALLPPLSTVAVTQGRRSLRRGFR
jgi:hypothetical protein